MILGFVEYDDGALSKLSLEMLTFCRGLAEQLGAPLEAVLIGEAARPLAADLGAYGVAKVHVVAHEKLAVYAPEAWAESIVQLAAATNPQALAAAGSERGNEVMAHVAARTDSAMAANCIAVRAGDAYEVTRVRWGGSLLEEARLHGAPKLFTVAAHAHEAAKAPAVSVPALQAFAPRLSEKEFRVQVSGRESSGGDKVSLTDARVVVGGGRGVGSSAGFAALEELADLLGGAVGCSRAVTSAGWRSHADQVGQTGLRIAPDLYIASGISGAIQHMVGAKGSKRILAINTDPEAQIVAKADYAIIADLHVILPAISAAVRQEQTKG